MHPIKPQLLRACPGFECPELSECLLSLASHLCRLQSWHAANEKSTVFRGGIQGCSVTVSRSGYLARQG